jgi:hydrogenase maturation protein HypF
VNPEPAGRSSLGETWPLTVQERNTVDPVFPTNVTPKHLRRVAGRFKGQNRLQMIPRLLLEVATLRVRLEVSGAVQGVGFRPYVFRLATDLGLVGWVTNNTHGVVIEVQGAAEALDRFTQRLPAELPRVARIDDLSVVQTADETAAGFFIRKSSGLGARTTIILPDLATCDDCLGEIVDGSDRRFRYPFTNCTNCGPRFSIITDLPYDRPNTTMTGFVMCAQCQTEYEDPLDRRFHAQPNACSDCGPALETWSRTDGTWRLAATQDEALSETADAIVAGAIVAMQGLGGFHLIVDARNTQSIETLRRRKPRPHKPLAVMVGNLDQAREIAVVTPRAEATLRSVESPIVLLAKREDNTISEAVAPAFRDLGLMLAYTPLHHLLLKRLDFPVVATSGNVTDEPISTDPSEAFERLGHIADRFLIHNRPIQRHVDDSVVRILDDRTQVLRRARGYAPQPVRLADPSPSILAVGGHLKNTVAVSVGVNVFVSQHIGDLETPEAIAAFERVVTDLLRMYEVDPIAIVHDLHPDYASTQWARSSPLADRVISVQHHHAHLASCLADNKFAGPALGVTWDGTGYGTDDTVWGGEFLLGDASGYERIAHLRTFGLPGGDSAALEPRRVALSLLWEHLGDEALEHPHTRMVFDPTELAPLARMLETGFRTPRSSSAGRLFDGVASLLGLSQRMTFEGQAAMSLENIVDWSTTDSYPPLVGEPLDWGPLLGEILEDLDRGTATSVIAARFHNTLVATIVMIAQRVGTEAVALTGGCFQNRVLTERTADALRSGGFEVLVHRQVPPNDGGISLGQVAVAAAIIRAERVQE